MDPLRNPYTPGAGTKPRALAGRDEEIRKAQILFERSAAGRSDKSMIIVGLRGVGKTVLLNTFADLAQQQGYHKAHIEIAEGANFAATVARAVRRILLGISPMAKAKDSLVRAVRVLKAFTVTIPDGPSIGFDIDALTGSADSGNLSEDLCDLMVEVGKAAKDHGTQMVFLFDELQYLDQDSLAALISAVHRTTQEQLPLVVMGAGLPQLPALAGEAKSYAERLFDYPEIGSLKRQAALDALEIPAAELEVKYDLAAREQVITLTQGYPYFIQEYGKHIWNIARCSPITVDDVNAAMPRVQSELDASFFRVRADRATMAERRYMRAMAEIGAGPYKSGEISDVLGVKVTSVGPTRSQLIRKGFIYSPGHGLSAFTVPQFDDFMRRNYPPPWTT